MTQYNFATIDPTTKSGSGLATDLNGWVPAVLSHHKGSSAPTYAVAGILWVDDSATPWALKLYDGTSWQTIGTFNATTHQFTPVGALAPQSGGTSTAYTVTNSPAYAALQSYRMYAFTAHTACGTAPTVNIDGLGAKTLKKFSGGSKVNLAAADIPSGALVQCLYDGTDMVVSTVATSATGSYDSGNQTITASGSLTLAHGLGAKPRFVRCFLKCTSAHVGYSVGDEVEVSPNSIYGSTDGFSLWSDTTNIYVRYASGGTVTIIRNASAYDAAGVGSANWVLVVRAYA